MSLLSHETSEEPQRKLRSYKESDVADPTIILDKKDTSFVETWAERKAAKAMAAQVDKTDEIKPKRRRGCDPGRPHPNTKCRPELDGLFRSLWAEGHSIKSLAHRFGCSESALKAWRKRLELKPRWETGPAHKKDRSTQQHVWLSEKELTLVRARARSRNQSVSAYLRNLALRDCA